jgi:hypothetical protein
VTLDTRDQSVAQRRLARLVKALWRGLSMPEACSFASGVIKESHLWKSVVPIKPWPERAGIYFVHGGDYIKIGKADNVRKRLRGLQTAHSEPLRLLAVAPGSEDEERGYHARFSQLRVRGEWFKPADDLLEEVLRLREATRNAA